ncbi:hypothetical protein [Streptomyces sp. NBC_00316]|uniref:hypothetical protein n=2 Tax=unclassified Streptomyces TaxID=2593676 RepID=UPI002E2E6222|nr:hypothetical protein [Streptomyces sp. NBC_00316]
MAHRVQKRAPHGAALAERAERPLPDCIEKENQTMPHLEGQRVEYRDDQNKKCQGEIKQVSGNGPAATYVIKNEQTQRDDRVREMQIEQDL